MSVADHEELVLSWMVAGWTFRQCSDEYERLFGERPSPTAWGNFRGRHSCRECRALIPYSGPVQHKMDCSQRGRR